MTTQNYTGCIIFQFRDQGYKFSRVSQDLIHEHRQYLATIETLIESNIPNDTYELFVEQLTNPMSFTPIYRIAIKYTEYPPDDFWHELSIFKIKNNEEWAIKHIEMS